MKKHFKVEIRKTCLVCGDPLVVKRQRTYCSEKCRVYATNKRNQKYQTDWQRERNNRKASIPSKYKIQCQICGRWYRQVGSHVTQVHGMTARKYREQFGFDVKRGQVSDDLRQLYKEQVFENGTVNNLKAGKKYRFKKGQKGVGVYTRSLQTLERLKIKSKKPRLRIKSKKHGKNNKQT